MVAGHTAPPVPRPADALRGHPGGFARQAKNMTIDAWNPPHGAMVMDPKTTKAIKIAPNCDHPTTKPTICDPKLRTMNTQAECGGSVGRLPRRPFPRRGILLSLLPRGRVGAARGHPI